jgi:hypothetical protein
MNTKEDVTKKEDEITEKGTCGCTSESVTKKEDEITEKGTCGCTSEDVCASEDVCTEEDVVEEVDRDVINDILSIFEDPESAYPLDDVLEELEGLGYKNPGGALTLALQDDVIYVDSIEDSGMVYLAVTDTEKGGEE